MTYLVSPAAAAASSESIIKYSKSMFSSSRNPDEQLLHSRLLQVEQREEEKEERGVTDSEGERQRGKEREREKGDTKTRVRDAASDLEGESVDVGNMTMRKRG